MNALLFPKHPSTTIVEVVRFTDASPTTGVQVEQYPSGKQRGFFVFAGEMCYTELLPALGAKGFIEQGRHFVLRKNAELARVL
jgi:hypothetical protein